MKYIHLLGVLLLIAGCHSASTNKTTRTLIHNGLPWFDDQGNIVNAHGACIVEENGRYYLFGEYKSNGANAFYGFSCYSSDDLSNWKFEKIVLGVQPDGILGSNRIGERVKVMKCPSSGEYVMYMHCDDMKYMDPYIGYATCETINGDYKFQGALLYEGEPIRRWDMGTFQDIDGTGYLLIHHGIIYRLSDDYRSAEAKVANKIPGSGESPAMLKKGDTYFLLYSDLTSWERNDNYYFTAPAIEGPWTKQGFFCPEGTLTYNSQCTFVLKTVRENDTTYMYMGDRWSFPHQSDAATYVWLPLVVENEKLSIPEYWEAWNFNTKTPIDPLAGGKIVSHKKIHLSNKEDWKIDNKGYISNTKNSWIEIPFRASQIAVVGESNDHGAYAIISITDKNNKQLHSSFVDFYSKKADKAVRYKSPRLPKDDYMLRIEVTGIMSEWFQKNGTRFGSKDTFVTINNIVTFE